MIMRRLGERVPISVWTKVPNFDRACGVARQMALREFGVDDDGHLTKVYGSDRSTDCALVRFLSFTSSGSVSGWQCLYEFEAWVERVDLGEGDDG